MLYRYTAYIEAASEEEAVGLLTPLGMAITDMGITERDYVIAVGEVIAPPDWKQVVAEAISMEASFDLMDEEDDQATAEV